MDGSQVSLPKKSGSRDLAFGLENLRMKALEVQGAMPCCFGSQTPAVVMATSRRRSAAVGSCRQGMGITSIHINQKTLRRWSIQMFFGTPNHVYVENICSKIIYYDILIHGGIILKLLISRTQQEVNRWCQHGAAAPGKAQRNRGSKQLKRGGFVFFSEPVAAGAAGVVNLGPWITKKTIKTTRGYQCESDVC